jgi:hypothetical protein
MVGEFSDREYAVGVTDEVVAFANNIAMHPETWLDFPLADEEDDDGSFLALNSPPVMWIVFHRIIYLVVP